MSNSKILERIYIKGKLQAISPLIIGSGEDQNTDIDLIRDAENIPFIPGTSLAGCTRHFLKNLMKDTDKAVVETVFGKKEKESIQSLLMFFDSFPSDKSSYTTSVRDGIKLDYETKTVDIHKERKEKTGGAKYDYEIVETGALFEFKMEIVIRESILKDIEKDKIYDLVYWLLESLKDGKIDVGAKTRRGYGRISLIDSNILKLDMKEETDINQWMNFHWKFKPNIDMSYFKTNKLNVEEKTGVHISASFRIPYSLLIRHYSIKPSDEDATHLMSGENPVIPGTSWNGAISHGIYNILMELGYDESNFNHIKEDLFGIEKGKTPKASRIIFEESIIKDFTSIPYTRNKVDRFTGGVVDSALFDEKPVYGGTTVLNITIKEAKDWEVGLILLALKDMGNGIQSVGGDGNIGRGVLETERKNISVNNDPLTLEKEKFYFNKLYDRLNSMKGETNG